MAGINVVFGTAGHNSPGMGFTDNESILESFELLKRHNVKDLDTAIIYGDATVETKLGELTPWNDGFVVSTKWPGAFRGPGGSKKEKIIPLGKESLEKLKVKQVDIFYLHSPDPATPLEDTLAGVNEVYKTGAFKRFGISNFIPEDVKKTYQICKDNGYVLPTVFQGIYSPINRQMETDLLPILRERGISFYAYSPLAGGFLTKTKEQIEQGVGRFNKDVIGGAYLYFKKPGHLEILKDWEQAAKDSDCSRAELAYRWVTYNSALKREFGDAIILGANGPKQLEQTLVGLEHGPLSEAAAKKIDGIWDAMKHEAKLDMFH